MLRANMTNRPAAVAPLLALLTLAACIPGRGGASPTPPAAAAPSVAAASQAPAPQPTATLAGAAYIVKDGDTLSGIAASNSSTVEAISRANNLSDPDKLQIGQQLLIPSAG